MSNVIERDLAVSPEQIALMKHTMENDRNWFGAGNTGEDYRNLELLRLAGFMTRVKSPSWVIDDWVYSLNNNGKRYLKQVN